MLIPLLVYNSKNFYLMMVQVCSTEKYIEHRYCMTLRPYYFGIEKIFEMQGSTPMLLSFSSIVANRTKISSVRDSQAYNGLIFSMSMHRNILLCFPPRLYFRVLKNLVMGLLVLFPFLLPNNVITKPLIKYRKFCGLLMIYFFLLQMEVSNFYSNFYEFISNL